MLVCVRTHTHMHTHEQLAGKLKLTVGWLGSDQQLVWLVLALRVQSWHLPEDLRLVPQCSGIERTLLAQGAHPPAAAARGPMGRTGNPGFFRGAMNDIVNSELTCQLVPENHQEWMQLTAGAGGGCLKDVLRSGGAVRSAWSGGPSRAPWPFLRAS